MTKPVRMWAVLDFGGEITEFTIKRTRRAAIDAWLAMWTKPSYQKWARWKRQGYSVRKVIVSLEAE